MNFYLDVIEAVTLNVAEQNERILKMISLIGKVVDKNNKMFQDLNDKVNRQEEYLTEFQKHDYIKWIKDYFDHSSETTKE